MPEENINAVIAELEHKCAELPDNFIAHHHLALVYRKAGRPQDAIRELKRAIELDDNSAEPYVNLGAVYFELGDLDQALAANKKALTLMVKPAQAHVNIGLIHLLRGQLPALRAAQLRPANGVTAPLAIGWSLN